MYKDKYDFLKEKWNGWRWGLIKLGDEVNIHEFYQSDDGAISWTKNPTGPDGCWLDDKGNKGLVKALRKLADLIENEIWFTEKELYTFNDRLKGFDDLP